MEQTATSSTTNNLNDLRFSVDPHSVLSQMTRASCPKCNKTFKFFCYHCQTPLPNTTTTTTSNNNEQETTTTTTSSIPQFHLPLKTIVIQHKNEKKGKSTAIHAKVLCPDSVEIYEYPDIPQELIDHASNAVLLYPSADAITVEEVIRRNSFYHNNSNHHSSENITTSTTASSSSSSSSSLNKEQEIKYVVFIDSTWQQSKGIFRDERLSQLTRCKITSQKTKFWRYQQHGEEFLATIEAIYYFFKEYQIEMNKLKLKSTVGDEQQQELYSGEYDDLLFFYAYQYDLIQHHYKERPDLKFTHRKGENYIKYDKEQNKRQAVEQQPNGQEDASNDDVDVGANNSKRLKL